MNEPHSYIPSQPGWIVCEPCDDRYTSPSDGDSVIGWRLPDMAPLTAEQGEPWCSKYVIVAPDGKVYSRPEGMRWNSWAEFIASQGVNAP